MRSSKSGKGPGLTIPIFGGLHGDVPLEPTAGKVIAELVVEQRLTCVLDVSEFETRQGLWQFLIDFGETLLRRNRQVLHLFLEEADEYLPQKTSEKGNLPKCLGVWQRVVKRGRFRGIGCTQITQRNASLNKDTLYMSECLFALRVTGKADREAVRGWVDHHNAAREIVDSLPSLPDGEGWVSSPAWLRKTERVKFGRRRTFDSGGTPVLLDSNAPPATLADVDLDQLRTRMAATIEKAQAEDPQLLRDRIGKLERELAAAKRAAPPGRVEQVRTVVEKIEVPMLSAGQVAELRGAAQSLHESAGQTGVHVQALRVIQERAEQLARDVEGAITRAMKPVQVSTVKRVDSSLTLRQRVQTSAKIRPQPPVDGALTLATAQRKLLNALAFLHDIGFERADRTQLCLFAGLSPTAGHTGNMLGGLRTAGLIEYPSTGQVVLTDAGRAVADPGNVPQTAEEMHAHLLTKVAAAQRKILTVLIAAYPEALERREAAERAGLSPDAGHTGNMFGGLRTMGVIDYPLPGTVVALPVLFLENAR